jgi:predicted nuclease of predicted toxin-antitoxin system
MSAPKLYLNEHLSPRLASQLRQYGFDVVSTVEAGLRTASDDDQFIYAVSQQRAIVTFNHRDFAVIHSQHMAQSKEHWGIIFSTEETLEVLRRRLLRLLNTLTDEELKNQIRWLNEFK